MSLLPNAHALIIGVGSDLPVTVLDATAIYNILANEKIAGYDPNNITLLTEENATRKGILKAFDDLIERTDENSSVMLFYSGHGGTYSDNTFLDEKNQKPEEENRHYFHLVPFGFHPQEYESTWVSAEELKQKMDQINPKRLVFFLDCCHAAGMTQAVSMNLAGSFGRGDTRLSNADELAQKLDDGKGMSIISSCREDQQSYILDGDHNSLFTKTLLEVLRGEHKKQFEEPYITIFEAVQYIFKMVPRRHDAQNPYANLQLYDDIILSLVPEKNRPVEMRVETTAIVNQQSKQTEDVVTVFKESENSNSVMLFVHGFSGEAADTFGKIPEWLIKDSNIEGWDLFPLGYSENIHPEKGKDVWASIDDIERIADYLAASIKQRYAKYHRIAIVGHSLGGLVAQRAILKLKEQDRSRISHLILFATPSAGLSSEAMESIWNQKNKDLASDGKFITQLRTLWDDSFNENIPFAFKTVAATKDEFIPIESSLKPFPEDHWITLVGSHYSIVQPDVMEDDSYNLILDTLNNNEFKGAYSDTEEVNLLLGEYTEVKNRLLPNWKELDKKGLVQLVFALEGLGEIDMALEILNKHPIAVDNSDIQGILGGRYKRKYLTENKAEFGKRAFEYYSRGLEMSEAKSNRKQIYYHAINLAFLSLVMNEDEDAMLKYARKALDAAEADRIDSLWKLATLAEANLYLGNFDEAQEFYERAAAMAGVREKISIHTNAYAAYTSLLQSDNPEDDFIVFLKKNFLS